MPKPEVLDHHKVSIRVWGDIFHAGASIFRIGVWGILYYNYNYYTEPLKIVQGNY